MATPVWGQGQKNSTAPQTGIEKLSTIQFADCSSTSCTFSLTTAFPVAVIDPNLIRRSWGIVLKSKPAG